MKKYNFAVKFILMSVIINILSVTLHESGHAFIYVLQGYNVYFHFAHADPISGVNTLLGSSGGLIFTILSIIIVIPLDAAGI